jgi:hypothetical protein
MAVAVTVAEESIGALTAPDVDFHAVRLCGRDSALENASVTPMP